MHRDDLDHWYSNGIDLRARVLYLGNIAMNDEVAETCDPGIHWNTARRAIMGLHVLETPKKQDPITIILNSCGGDWSHGMAIHNAIRACKNHVTIINMSHARSMTSIIYQAGDLRITAPDGYYMIHDGVTTEEGIPRTVANSMNYEVDVMLPRMYQVYLDRLKELDEDGEPKVDVRDAMDILNPKMPKGAKLITARGGINSIKLDHIQQLCAQDTYFTPDEMVKLNFADRILERGDLAGAYRNPKMAGLPTGLSSLYEDEEE